ncbi:metallo-dependent phosphatase-like protein [Vibrio phage 3.058.O._10N.286.46.B8]|nr:metallo-dependent phosphatase-like protein [Vibrio phage 2.058.O._10N.286.46.B8]AUS03185.1 metallo-dependent phosphatase-like protein [Vibrio phage 3.058.O._10N.286.46.B8]
MSNPISFKMSDNILWLGDTHGGVRDGNELVMAFQLQYLVDVVIKYCLENQINTIIQLGDIWEVRRATNNNVSDRWKKEFFDVLEHHGIQLITIVGNHDAYYKNRIKPNFTNTLLSKYSNITIIQDPTEMLLNGTKYAFVPWICKDNYNECINMIENTDAEIMVGHYEIKGARMESGVCEDGMPMEKFARFKKVVSGHFHTQGVYGNIQYAGTPYETTWADYGEAKGFWTSNTAVDEMVFHRNENPLHIKVSYVEENNMDEVFEQDLKNKYIKVTVESRENFKKYEKWLMRLETMGMFDLKIIEPMMSLDSDESDMEVDVDNLDVVKTEDMIVNYVGDVYPDRADRLSKMMLGLHAEAENLKV